MRVMYVVFYSIIWWCKTFQNCRVVVLYIPKPYTTKLQCLFSIIRKYLTNSR